MRICRVVTVPITFETLYREQLIYFAHQGTDVTIVSSPGAGLETMAKSLNMNYYPIHMARKVEPFHDLHALIVLTRLLRRSRFTLQHAQSRFASSTRGRSGSGTHSHSYVYGTGMG